jgi:hypothetical protein
VTLRRALMEMRVTEQQYPAVMDVQAGITMANRSGRAHSCWRQRAKGLSSVVSPGSPDLRPT